MDLLKVAGRILVLVVLMYVLMFYGISYAYHSEESYSQNGNNSPRVMANLGQADFSWILKTLDGKEVKLSDFRGRVIFINLWATWCGPCAWEMPSLQKLYDKLNPEVVFIFASYESPVILSRFLNHRDYTFPVYTFSKLPEVFSDESANAIPTTFIIDTEGVIVYKHVGAKDWDTQEVVDFLRVLKDKILR